MELQNVPNHVSRRSWLRDAAIAATGAAVLPSLLTSCTDHRDIGLGGPKDVPLTDFQLYSAAQNLIHMNDWIDRIYPYCIQYNSIVYHLLKSGEKGPTKWSEFVLDIFFSIGTGLLEAAAEEIPFSGAVIAIAADSIKSWAVGKNRPPSLEASFSAFEIGHQRMQLAITKRLLELADDKDNYKNLREAWTGEIEFNGKKYTLRDLAGAQFPTERNGTEYIKLRDAALTRFKKYIWNAMIIKAGDMSYSDAMFDRFYNSSYHPTHYAERFYPKNKAVYLRGFYDKGIDTNVYRYWYFTFDGLQLSDEAAAVLFNDYWPGNVVNPDGLFNRDYVFKQFHIQKPDFLGYHDIRNDFEPGPGPGDAYWFNGAGDTFNFTGGDLPELTKK